MGRLKNQQIELFEAAGIAAATFTKPSPEMVQYHEMKCEAGEPVLLAYRMGDFYEFFFADAEKCAQALDIALTRRAMWQGQYMPMCGFPVHSAERYIHALVSRGYAVAICETVERAIDAARQGRKVPDRAILRVVAPQEEAA